MSKNSKPVLRASQSASANAAFDDLEAVWTKVPGLRALRGAVGKKGINLASDEYLELAFRAVDQMDDLRAATKVDTAASRQDIAFCKAYAPLPAMAQRLSDSATLLLNTKLQALTKSARGVAKWLAWKADVENDPEAQKLVKQLKGLPRGRSASTTAAMRGRRKGVKKPKAATPSTPPSGQA
jgi:hypothetical protein